MKHFVRITNQDNGQDRVTNLQHVIWFELHKDRVIFYFSDGSVVEERLKSEAEAKALYESLFKVTQNGQT